MHGFTDHLRWIARTVVSDLFGPTGDPGSPTPSRCPVMRGCRALRSAVGFTLIELLVVVAMIALLVSLILPALGRIRSYGRQCKEMVGARELMTAFTLYADTNKGFVLPGYPPVSMVNGDMVVIDHEGDRLTGDTAQRFPWRIAPYLNYDFRGLYGDERTLNELRDRRDQYAQYNVSYEYVVSLFPSLGMNVAFIGGSDRHQSFDPSFRRDFGTPYLRQLADCRRPAELMAFVSARAEEQVLLPGMGRFEGFFRVEPPVYYAENGLRWQDAYDPDARVPGNNSGFVSLRYSGRAVAAMIDGHSEALAWGKLRDMRRWADQATSETWGLETR